MTFTVITGLNDYQYDRIATQNPVTGISTHYFGFSSSINGGGENYNTSTMNSV